MEKIEIQGHWLKLALNAQKVTPYAAAKRANIRVDNLYHHISNKFHLSALTLSALAREFPTMNIRFILTGEGPPILPA